MMFDSGENICGFGKIWFKKIKTTFKKSKNMNIFKVS